ncbi:uncharacterized protein FA14DRAFT_153114 [Meira miltonrushii]|uniref:Uncharacterized protein n=1 Tax=Meira miltonrushii TaxID=1280837 RepID=A0A316VJM8_9BASI|nr:uncharacterized protein FA14DRAFT_153114 [Meira miltonrushii]PWN37756.1 hypothetical protein FA14DRAFT_153114 [Meira miltonrushii]
MTMILKSQLIFFLCALIISFPTILSAYISDNRMMRGANENEQEAPQSQSAEGPSKKRQKSNTPGERKEGKHNSNARYKSKFSNAAVADAMKHLSGDEIQLKRYGKDEDL